MAPPFVAVILAGGRASRLSGLDKMSIEVGGRSLLQRSVDAVAGAEPVVVVGPCRAVVGEVVWTRERPPGAGPVAALAAGIAALPDLGDATELAVLAADLRNIEPATVDRLRWAIRSARDFEVGACEAVCACLDRAGAGVPRDFEVGACEAVCACLDRAGAGVPRDPVGAVLVDGEGVRQWLIGVWRLGALRRALPAEPAGRSLHAVLGSAVLVEVPAEPDEAADVDTPADLP
jgi:molybdopterin-guanine dinucleotide biosynthesis protein A